MLGDVFFHSLNCTLARRLRQALELVCPHFSRYNTFMELPYWQRQTPERPLFPDIEWNKPEQRSRAGKLGIIGGNKLGFAGVAEAYSTALASGAGEARALLPDILKNTLPRTMAGVTYAPSNPSGGLAQESISELRALSAWSDGLLLIGDAGRNRSNTQRRHYTSSTPEYRVNFEFRAIAKTLSHALLSQNFNFQHAAAAVSRSFAQIHRDIYNYHYHLTPRHARYC